MSEDLLTYLSHQFCAHCCGSEKKFDCDSRGVTCTKLAAFLVSCKRYEEPVSKFDI